MSTNPAARRRTHATLAGLIAAASAALVLAVSGAHEGHADGGHGHGGAVAVPAKPTAEQAAFQDAMRKLWEDHVTWTRLAIVSLAHDLPDLPATQARLLRNQVDIGNAIKPYYGRAAGNQLTALLKEHIVGAVALVTAAKAGDQNLIGQRSDEWYANGNEIADFLHEAAQLVTEGDAPDDEGASRPDRERGRQPAERQVRRRRPRLRRDPRPHPHDGRHAEQGDHQAVPAPLPVVLRLIVRSADGRPATAGTIRRTGP
jgi:hypothetical protein